MVNGSLNEVIVPEPEEDEDEVSEDPDIEKVVDTGIPKPVDPTDIDVREDVKTGEKEFKEEARSPAKEEAPKTTEEPVVKKKRGRPAKAK